jgi:hypothetical protein
VNWPNYNQSLVRRGEILLGFDIIDIWDTELKEMNKDIVGEPFHFPNTFLLLLGYPSKAYFHLPYRQTEGIIKATGKSFPSHPSYGHICKRTNKLNIKIKEEDDIDEDIVIAVDSTGIKVTNRGQWMYDKWDVRKGYFKIHIAVDVKIRKFFR